MSEIVGSWEPGADRETIRARLDRQYERAAAGYPSASRADHVDAGVGMALVDSGIHENGAQPALSEDRRHVVLLYGELSNAPELSRELRGATEADLSPARICLELLRAEGAGAAARLDGQFAIVWYDAQARCLTLITDRFGYRPVFWTRRGDAVLFGSSLKSVAAADPDPLEVDDVGILELFCYGTHVLDRSWIRGYRRLPPATAMRIAPDGTTTERYWVYGYDEGAPTLDQRTYATVFARLMDRAVERRMRGSRKIGIFLSGGYDSRAVAGAIRREHLPIPAFTFGVPDSRDVRFAATLAERLGFRFHHLHRSGAYLEDACRAVAWRNEGMVPFSHNTSILYHDAIKPRADFILTGFLGEYSGSHTWPRLLLTRSRRAAIPVIFDRMTGARRETARRVFRREFFDATFDALRARFVESFDRLPNDHPMDLSDSWDFTCRHPWSYQPSAVDRHLLEVRAPQFDIDLLEFLLTIPWHQRIEQRVYKRMIAHAYPEIRDVPCTNSGKPIDPRFGIEYAKMAARFVGRKSVDRVRALFTTRQPLGRELSDLAADFRREVGLRDAVLLPLVREGVFDPAMFRPEEIERIADEHWSGRARHEDLLARLITWGLARRSLDESTPPPPVGSRD